MKWFSHDISFEQICWMIKYSLIIGIFAIAPTALEKHILNCSIMVFIESNNIQGEYFMQ